MPHEVYNRCDIGLECGWDCRKNRGIVCILAGMTMSTVSVEHIHLDERGVARIIGSRTKVIQIVMDRMAHGWTAEEIQRQHPHLSLAAIYDAFAFYYDHQDELDEQIRQSLLRVEEYKREFPMPELAQRIRAERANP